jgi:hypothetical protein
MIREITEDFPKNIINNCNTNTPADVIILHLILFSCSIACGQYRMKGGIVWRTLPLYRISGHIQIEDKP